MNTIFKLLLALCIVAVASCTSGCATLTGGRDYSASTETRADGTKKCEFTISSTSNLMAAGFKACDGAFEAQAASVNQGNSAADFNALLSNFGAYLTGKAPAVAPAQPAPAPKEPAKPPGG